MYCSGTYDLVGGELLPCAAAPQGVCTALVRFVQRHVALKDALVGSQAEVNAPITDEVRAAINRAHSWATDDRSVNVFFIESWVTPRYPCPQEERIGTVWGDGGKASSHFPDLTCNALYWTVHSCTAQHRISQ